MGIKAIKSIESGPIPSAVFDISNMIRVKVEPITDYYKFLKKIGEGTYGEVFKVVHEQTGNQRAVKKINALKFPRAKTMTLNEMALLKALVRRSPLRTTPPSSRSTRSTRRRSSSTSSLSTARGRSCSTSSSTSTISPRRRPATCSTKSHRQCAACTPTGSCTGTPPPTQGPQTREHYV
jgi:hypothetical protein